MTAVSKWTTLIGRAALAGALFAIAFVVVGSASGQSSTDTTPPTVSITSPAAGTNLSGTVTVSADASDDVGVASVTFQLYNGATQAFTPIGTAVTTPPYSVQFDTTAAPNCEPENCTIYATAVDTSGNSTRTGIGVGIANPIVVGTTADETTGSSCSLRAAIASANNNDAEGGCKNGLANLTDTVEVPAGTYDLSAQLLASSNVNIVGENARVTVIDAAASGQRAFEIDNSATVGIKGVTIEGGNETSGSPTDNPGVGGGIWVDSGSSLTLQDSTVSGNHADVSGGGIDNNGSLTVVGSTIENNSAGCGGLCRLEIGGGIDDFGASVAITNSTIMGNSASGDGGGLYLANTTTLTNDTIANNQADLSAAAGAGGGAITVYGGANPRSIELVNTLLAGNTWNGDGGSECSTAIESLGHNLADDASCGLTSTGDEQYVDPQLGPVDSTGPTDVLPLAFGSPAIDAGDDTACPATDQRGVTRPQGPHCDIGAYEFVPGGSLSGSMSTSGGEIDLTTLGGTDWAVWGYGNSGTSTSLAPDVRKAGGGVISDLTDVNPTTTPLRGIGQFGSSGELPFSFDWSDGSGTTSATGAYTGLQHDGEQTTTTTTGDGFSFTVPADPTERTLTVFTSEHWGTGTLTATLSDGSAAPYSQSLVGSTSSGAPGQNAPGVFTIDYKAASAGQHLTVTWTESAASYCDTNCDNAAIYAVALSGGGTTTSASATFAAGGDQTVEMSGSNDAIPDIPLSAFEVTPSGITPAPINGLPINGLPINGLPINGLPINGLPINGLPINGLPINGLPINGLPINGLPINGLPINGLPINGLPLDPSQYPGGWSQVLESTALAGLPLQTITLQQVLALNPQPSAFQAHPLTLGGLQLSGSALGQMTIGALALGGTPINGLGTEAATIEQQLQAWCESVDTGSDPAADCSLANIGGYSLFGLGLAGAPINGLPINGLPINGLPINGLPINGLPINGLDLSASPINGLPINGLPINGLPINGLPVVLSDVVDCTKVDCATATLGQAAAAGAIVSGATYGQLISLLVAPGSAYQNTITLGDLIGLLIKRADVPWETLPPRVLSVFDPNRPKLSLTAGFTLQGSGTPAADVQVQLPDGFDYDPGSVTLSAVGKPQEIGGPKIDGQTLDWHLPSVVVGVPYSLGFEVRSGTTVGPAQAVVTVTSGSQSATSTAPFTVTDSFPGDSSPANAAPITPDTGVQMSTLPTPGAVDWYEIPLPETAGTRLHVHLTDLPADYDLALYAPATTSVRTGVADQQAPLQGGVLADQPINLGGGSNGQLPPTALQDVPADPGVPLVQVSANRGTDDEEVGMVAPGGGGDAWIAVYGYNGAFSPQPYSLRVTTQAPPPTLSCTARTFPSTGTTPDEPPDLSNLPTNLNTIILVNEERLGATYGSTSEANAVAKLHDLAGDASLGVSGVVVPVEQIPGVQAEYDTWDANPCNNDAANAIANSIANEVDAIKAARPTVEYVVFAGGDDQIPFFRIPDLTLIDNESGFASQFGLNEYRGSTGAGDLLTDNPYLDTRPISASGRQLFIPDLVGGRLVETADEIANAVTSFESSGGILKSSSAFVSGYDFVADGSQLAANRLSALGVNVTTLIDSTTPFVPSTAWSASTLLSEAFPGGVPFDINNWNGHYDNTRAEMANGDLLSTSDLTGSHALSGGIFFTMGCHAGFQTTDAVIGSTVLDWPQYFAEHDTGFVGNTGYGYGSTDSVAFSEELMADFAGQLGGSVTLGQALTQAKDEYYLSRVAFSPYDEKTLSEAELYGLPMYGVGKAPTSLMAAVNTPSDPVVGTSRSSSPASQSSLSSFPGTGVQSASFSATPSFTLEHGADGDYYTNAGQVQAPNYRPLQPYISMPATQAGLVAHGVVIDGLTSQDHTPFDPDNVRPVIDLSANEPEPQFTDEAWPEKIPTLVTLGSDQTLNLATGQFFTDTSGSTPTGVERLWTQISGRVTYSTSTDFTPPTIDSIDAYQGNGNVAFAGHFSDTDQPVVFAQVVYDDGTGTWHAVALQHDSSSDTWSGGVPFSGQHVQFFVEACDAAGNCGYSSNKGRYFDAQPLTSSTGGSLTLTPSGAPSSTGWYTSGLTVTASSSASTVEASVDGGPFDPVSGPISLATDGVHVVDARDAAGDTAEGVYLVDVTPPTPPTITGIDDGHLYPVDDLPPSSAIGCNSSDATSGVASCVVTGYSSAVGTHVLSATATDNAGNTSNTATLTYTVGFQAGNILPPVAAQSGDQIMSGAGDLQIFKINSTIPLKFQFYLDGAETTPMTTPPAGSTAIVNVFTAGTSTSSTAVETTLLMTSADTGNQFRWTGSPSYQYVYNMATKQLQAGEYYCTITLYDAGYIIGRSVPQYFKLRS